MRACLLLSLIAVAGSASASFELVLALDSNNHKVHRLDGENSIYFGSFGGNRLIYPTAMSVQPSTNRVHVFDSYLGSVLSFDYNTGEQVGEAATFSVGYGVMGLANNGNFLVGDFMTTTARQYSQSGVLLNSFAVPGGAIACRAMAQAADGYFYIFWAGINAVARYNSVGSYLGLCSGSYSSLGDCRQMFFQNGQVVLSGGSSSSWFKMSYSTGTWGTPASVGSTTYAYGVSPGHFSTVYSGGYASGPVSTINSYNLTTGYQRSTYTLPGSATVVALATVVAPEPKFTTGLFLLGSLGLVARRRRGLKKS